MTPLIDNTPHLNDELLPLLGATLISIQEVEYHLYKAIQNLCKDAHSNNIQTIKAMTSDQFLKGTTVEVKPTLLLLQNEFSDKLPISVDDISNFIYHRNLVTHSFWHAINPDVRESEKLADPLLFLQKLYAQCEEWISLIKR
ncbi:glucosamine-6-phosphate deaminase [Vibrionales bacterium C3R12]|uniref:glucosamine-6-phosphate deaminase n=1 Tax=Vibrio cortegadensis TaxID=1328770 RepID=UPI000DE9A2F3|nr:glucosamine-6-phosphate deaminase [Vibrionales bacterium C3R12]